MYRHRYLEDTILSLHRQFKILYLGGPRQAGKTTLLQHLSKRLKMRYVTLDDLTIRDLAQRDPGIFLERFPSPCFIDEVQYAPNLFPYLKMIVDQRGKPGLYWLSGSQHFALIRGLQESLAGRVAILSLLGFSWAEERRISKPRDPFSPTRTFNPDNVSSTTLRELSHAIFRGFLPYIVTHPKISRAHFYNSYVQTYLDRDVSDLFQVGKIGAFRHVLELVAGRTGQVLNVSDLARDAAVSVNAVRQWLLILEASNIIYFLRPYHTSRSKRIIKAPKMYMLDTGLAAYLTRWENAETVLHGAMAGALFETFVVSELVKSYLFRGLEPPFYYFRDKEGHEVDCLIERNGMLYPIEIKLKMRLEKEDLAGIQYLRKKNPNIGQGAVIVAGGIQYPIDRNHEAIPICMIS